MISALRQKSKFEFRTFLKKKIKILGFHGVVATREDLSIGVSISVDRGGSDELSFNSVLHKNYNS